MSAADRTDLLAQIRSAQADIDQLLAQFGNDAGTILADAQSQRGLLVNLERTLTTGTTTFAASIRNEIAGTIAVAVNLGQQARSANDQRASIELAAAQAASRTQVQAIMRNMHRFDPYLEFTSPEEEASYRRRESDRRSYIEQQQGRGTPEGDLNASAAAIGQMADAGMQGAATSPEFRQHWDELVASTRQLREQVQRNGGSTQEFDDRLRAELRSVLRARGVPEAQIEARLAAHPGDPLETARDLMSETDVRTLSQSMTTPPPAPVPAASAPPQQVSSVEEAMAEFRAAGIVLSEQQPSGEPHHGVARNERPAPVAGTALS